MTWPYVWQEFGTVIIAVLEEELGSGFSAEAKAAWTNGFRAMNAGLAKNLK